MQTETTKPLNPVKIEVIRDKEKGYGYNLKHNQ